ncbi:hypothetical protein NL676_037134 [Syzygium grande]|nr:hypothetical protein NL676_037134 [Syzygium grande]
MGCASSKQNRGQGQCLGPSSFTVFDINSIDEPWLLVNKNDKDREKDNAPPLDHLTLDGKSSARPTQSS